MQVNVSFDPGQHDGLTALMIASRWGDKKLISYLLELGVDADRCDGVSTIRWQITELLLTL
jgi:ankyrin repeat protein